MKLRYGLQLTVLNDTVTCFSVTVTLMLTPVIVDFPLRGQWISPNTPGTKVPSHGTDLLGVTYAYDFVGIDPERRGRRYYRRSLIRYALLGVRLQDFFGWGKPIFSAAAGVVDRAEDGWPERNPVHPIRDLFIRIRNARSFSSGQSKDYRIVSGNYIIVEINEGYAVYAHAQTGSIAVSPGDSVAAGQHLANVGHSGNSTAPHLHFQLMDNPDPWQARGLPCAFRHYEVFQDGVWRAVHNRMPKATDRIRKL